MSTHTLVATSRPVENLAFDLLDWNRCGVDPQSWGEAEIAHHAARTHAQAASAAAPAVALCGGCPVRGRCADWAAADSYSGLAAGHAWVDGVPHQPSSTRYQPLLLNH